ncbi:unnamed protein product [Medioppia subpectinata]|uniref:Uncharacterized protein n=1 Tax=Medioppia subpectinata TaxID=1979941 RepID=A0A7R9Q0L6_9ACAR|nr:unnamed protein product [Medioppia subpectinata]CAG2108222.1 unnamed protein product [Medioppia subpectinata]
MVAKLLIVVSLIAGLTAQTLALSLRQRVKRDSADDDLGISGIPEHIQMGSQQDSQSNQEQSAGKKGAAVQQNQLSQQQLAAAFGGKHYLLQQQLAMGQQMAKLGTKVAAQQVTDTQKQAVANGVVEKSAHSATNEEVGTARNAADPKSDLEEVGQSE